MNRKHYIAIGVFAAAFVGVTYLGWSLLIKPERVKIAAKLVEKDDVSKKLQEAKSKAAQYDKFRSLSENIRRDLNFVVQRLDGDLGKKELYRIFDQLVMGQPLYEGKLTYEKRDKSKAPGFSSLDEIPVKLDFNTDYRTFGEFLNRAVSNRRVLIPVGFDSVEAKDTGEIAGPTMKITALYISVFLENAK